MKKLLIATHNLGKFKEYQLIFKNLSPQLKLFSLIDLGIKDKIEETGKNYKENAILKAKFYGNLSGLTALGDDAGLEIDILGGAPGIKSRRLPGYEASDEELIKIILEKLRGFPKSKRRAWLRAVTAIFFPSSGKVFTSEGKIKGLILEKHFKKIIAGYPYRTIFYALKVKKPYVNFSLKEMATISHRAIAIKKLLPILRKI